MVGADLANLANEAALLAARRGHEKVQMADLTDSLEKIMLGSPRGILLSPADRERTAYHESGHALVGMLTQGADPVRKVSIIPRGMALGVTLSTPDSDRVSYSLEELARQDQGRPRWPCGRGGRSTARHHRRGVRYSAAHDDRPSDGRALGHERGGRPDRGTPRRRTGDVPSRGECNLRVHPASRGRGGQTDDRHGPSGGHKPAHRAPGAAWRVSRRHF